MGKTLAVTDHQKSLWLSGQSVMWVKTNVLPSGNSTVCKLKITIHFSQNGPWLL
jgi:hypothetical protein